MTYGEDEWRILPYRFWAFTYNKKIVYTLFKRDFIRFLTVYSLFFVCDITMAIFFSCLAICALQHSCVRVPTKA